MIEKKMIMIDEERLGFEEKMDVLLNGGCKGIFPISILKDDEGLKGFYSTSGYKPIKFLEDVSAKQALTLLEKTVEAIEECRQYLIFPDEFVISTETAYTSKDYSSVKFTYIPSEQKESVGVKLGAFVDELKKITTENGRLYLNMMEEMITLENLSFKGLKGLITQLKREINICDII